MDRIEIDGGNRLSGSLQISGAKNAALPLMVASLLSDKPLTLSHVPHLADIATLSEILAQHGVTVSRSETGDGDEVTLSAAKITSTLAPYDLVRKMRASFLVSGPLLAREGECKVSLPGGCAIGARAVDFHLKGFERLGAQIELADGYVTAKAPNGLKGAEYEMPFASVGATQNLLMAACLARGETVLRNVAREPENVDLVNCLIAMGAEIEGAGTSVLRIQGKEALNGARHRVLPDRIETGTYAMAVGAAGGEVTLHGSDATTLEMVIPLLKRAGVNVEVVEGTEGSQTLNVSRNGERHLGVDVVTEPYPGFPTDLQAQFMALMTTCQGTSHITEKIFENRFMHVPELCRLGANIKVDGQTATVQGVDQLKGAPVMATDLRASSGLIVAALGAKGTTEVNRVYHLDRGFEHIVTKLRGIGAEVRRVKA
jgi:UDP-N-acetylglucosamine 1-carboxyvinyltransferase